MTIISYTNESGEYSVSLKTSEMCGMEVVEHGDGETTIIILWPGHKTIIEFMSEDSAKAFYHKVYNDWTRNFDSYADGTIKS